jgi:hypothetical protein
VIRVYTENPVEIKENYFSQPFGRSDQLRAPDNFPPAEYKYTLTDLTLVWYIYGGQDFQEQGMKGESILLTVFTTLDILLYPPKRSVGWV